MKSRQQSGFTLIELVMVIVILGILAVVAIPQYVDLSAEAKVGATNGVAGALASASAINYAVCEAGNAACETVATCEDTETLLQGDTAPPGYVVAGGATLTACTVTHSDGTTQATFQAIAASP